MSIPENPKVTVVIPTFNEEKFIVDCLSSLIGQTYRNFQVVVVDDGSSDKTLLVARRFVETQKALNALIISRDHSGPGEARNFGALHGDGDILIFVDADMTFDPDFIKNLIAPIVNYGVIGTDSQEEYLANPGNYWARCWNIGRFSAAGARGGNPLLDMVPDKSNHGGIYRAITKSKFDEVGGFESGGAAWIAGGRNFTGSLDRKISGLIKFSFPVSLGKAIVISKRYNRIEFFPFKLLLDFFFWINIVRTLI